MMEIDPEEDKDDDKLLQTHQYPQSDQGFLINVAKKDSTGSLGKKDIYPLPNFTIDVPQSINTSNKLNLIFDPNIKKASSVIDIDFEP